MATRDENHFLFVRRSLITGTLALCLLYGCATTSTPMKSIASGDSVLLDYTCRLENGAIVATTRKAAAYDKDAQLSSAFVPLAAYGPAAVTVGSQRQPPAKPTIHPLTGEIAYRLSQQIEELTYGKTHHLTVTTEMISDLPKRERYLQFARTMRRPKQRSIPKAQFVANTGKEPEVGELLFPDRPIQWKVTDVQADSVALQYLAEDGQKVILPYGEAVIRDRSDHYDLEIDARVGNLVRIGPYIGRISELDDRIFMVDFEHPFGGRELACEVMARQADERTEQTMELTSGSNKVGVNPQ